MTARVATSVVSVPVRDDTPRALGFAAFLFLAHHGVVPRVGRRAADGGHAQGVIAARASSRIATNISRSQAFCSAST